jgi:uncharacterized membrane protein YuzA (DUF378 family)
MKKLKMKELRMNKNLALQIGLISFVVAILIKRFLPSTNIFSFLEGLLIGLSIVFNVRYFFSAQEAKKKLQKHFRIC